MTDRTAVFERAEIVLRAEGVRGHIYLTATAVVAFATRQARTPDPANRNVGPGPVLSAIRTALNGDGSASEWLRQLGDETPRGGRIPVEAVWNTPDLVVTGAMPLRALCAVLEHPDAYAERTATDLAAEAGVSASEALRVYAQMTNKNPVSTVLEGPGVKRRG